MQKPLASRRPLPLVVLAAAAAFPFAALAVTACGGGTTPPTVASNNTATSSPSILQTPSNTTSATQPAVTGSTMPTAPQPSKYTSKLATQKQNDDWLACHVHFTPGGKDISADVVAEGKGCELASGMHQLMATGDGVTNGIMLAKDQSGDSVPKKWKINVKGGKCYRAFAESTSGIKDLDMIIKDGDGNSAGEDSTDDPSPVTLEDGAVCFNADGTATVAATIGDGKGDFAVGVWTDE
jgi:hypothetical protein